MRRYVGVAVLVLFCLAGVAAMAQTVTGTLEGRVLDPTGAVIPNAQVNLKNEQTGLVRDGITNAEGYYAFRFVPIGSYQLTAKSQGFKTVRKAGVDVSLNTTTTSDFKLDPASVSEVVNVSGEAPLVETSTSDFKSTFETKAIEDRPLPTRNFIYFAETVPGFQDNPVSGQNNPTLSSGSSVNFNGTGTRGATFQINGVANDDSSENQQRQGVNISSIAQVQVLTNNFSAEFGRSYGTIVLVQTKQGTNKFHGDVYWFHLNSKFFARDYFQPPMVYNPYVKVDSSGKTLCTGSTDPTCQVAFKTPANRRHDYGFTIGGPILKNKLFFFGSFGQVRNGGSVAIRRDIFLPSEHSVPASVTNPADRAWIQKFLDSFPTASPNDPTNGPRSYLASGGYHYPDYDYSGRADWNINSKNTANIRYQWSHQSRITDYYIKAEKADQNNHQQNLALTYSHIFSNSQTGEFRLGFGRRETVIQLGDTQNWADGRVPVVRFSNANNPGSYCCSTIYGNAGAYPIRRFQTDWQFDYNHFWIATPKLTLKMGTDIRPGQLNDFADSFTRGYWQMRDQGPAAEWSSLTAAQRLAAWTTDPRCPWSGQEENCPYKDAYWSLRHGMMGVASGFTQSYGEASLANVLNEANFYIQADYRLFPSFTVMAGFRDEYVPEVTERNNKINYGYSSRNETAPRLGFSWSPQFRNGLLSKVFGEPGKSSFHGGYGIFTGRIFQSYFNQSGASVRFTPPYGIDPTWDTTPARTAYVPGYIADPTGGFVYSHALPSYRINTTIVDPHLYQPYSESWNLTMQRELTNTIGLSLAYVGNRGVGLPFYNVINRSPFPMVAPAGMFASDSMKKFEGVSFDCVDPNVLNANPISPSPGHQCISLAQTYANARRPDPRYGTVYSLRNGNRSWYNSMVASLKKRVSRGVMFDLNYTWGKALDTGSESTYTGVETNYPVTQFDDGMLNKGYSLFDTPHRISLNWSWQLPFFTDQRVHAFGDGFASGLFGRILGGWNLNGTYIWAKGTPFGVTAGYDLNADGAGGDRPDLLDPSYLGKTVNNPYIDPSTGLQYGQSVIPLSIFSPNNLTPSASRAFRPGLLNAGTLGRNTFRADGRNNVDASLQKDFKVTEGSRLAFRWEVYNVANRPQFGLPGGTTSFGSSPSTWMKITSTRNTRVDLPPGASTSARNMQFALRYIF